MIVPPHSRQHSPNGMMGDKMGKKGSNNAGGYDVGYGRPPKSGQIKPGEVRNPWGKTGKPERREDLLLKIAAEEIRASVNGRTTSMTQEEAAYRKLFQDALSGNATAQKLVMEHLSRRRPPLPPHPTPEEIAELEAEQARREELSAKIVDALEEMADIKRERGLEAAGLDFYGRPLRAKAAERPSAGPLHKPFDQPGG